MEQGIVFDISHYMIEDGPGIRTTVFLKGCPLRCKWCSNAYGLHPHLELAVRTDRCTHCQNCISACPAHAVSIDKNTETVSTDRSACTACFSCVEVCPNKARSIIGKKMTVAEVLKEVEKDRIYYRRGNGGVTLSGGEILMQADFARKLLKACNNAYLNTAIETSAFGNWEDLHSLILLCDTVFIDCKCMDDTLHQQLTGVSNKKILANIENAAKICAREKILLVIRLPLIPGYNDFPENLIRTALFVKTLPGSPKLNLLPYHNYGVSKYEQLGRHCSLENLSLHTSEELDRIDELLASTGVPYSIGGYQIDAS